MADQERETVVVEGDRRPSYGWAIVLGVIALIIILFFAFGGANLFTGTESTNTDTGTDTINVDTPDNINVQPSQ